MIGNSEGKLKGKGIMSMAIPAGALGPDKSNLPILVSKLKKKSRKGRWDSRYFRANNHYLTYFKSAKLAKICCCHDLCKAISIEINGRFGYFDVEFEDNIVSLKAKDLDEAELWVENLLARRKLFQGSLVSQLDHMGDGQPGRSGRANTGTQGGILLEGSLEKKSPSRFRGFQARYFILGDGLLRYYKTKPTDDELDSEMQGAVHVAGLISVLPDRTDKERLMFVLKMPGRTFELKARTTNECREWIRALDQAHNKMKNDNQALQDQVEEKAEKDAVAALPALVQMFDASDSNERAEKIMMHVVHTFEQHGADTIDGMVQGLTDCLEELSDMVETCISVDPPRVDIITEHINYYHGSILFKVNELTDEERAREKKEKIKAHEALRVMDFINAYSDLLTRAGQTGADVPSFSAADDDRVKDILDYLTVSYVSRAAPELKKMCHNISSFVIQDNGSQAMRDQGGYCTTTAPIDLNNMINQYVEISGRGGLDSLQARVFGMCLDGICWYHHDVELHCTDLGKHEDALFLCAIANDAEAFLTSLETLEDRFIDLIEAQNMEDELEATTMRCHILGQLALLQIESIIFSDLMGRNDVNINFVSTLFDNEWSNGNSDAMETILATLEDYFTELDTRLHHRSMVKLIGYCYNRFLVEYVSQMIRTYTKKVRSGARGSSKMCINPTTAQIIAGDLHHAKDVFTSFAETVEHSNGRAFRSQFQFSNWFEDIVYRTPVINLHEGVFRPMCSVHKSKLSTLPHAYCLMSQLTLCRDFKLEEKHWLEMKNMGLSEEEMKHMKKPPNRFEILKEGLLCLENVYELSTANMRELLEVETTQLDKIERVIQQHDYTKSLQLLTELLVNQSTDHDEVKSILDHHKHLKDDGKITTEELDARSVQEGKLLQIRETKNGSLLTRICSHVLEQLNADESTIRPSTKKRSMGMGAFKAATWGFGKRKSTENKKEKEAALLLDSVEREAYKMWQTGVIDKEQYDQIVQQHQKLEMAESKFDEEREALKQKKSMKLANKKNAVVDDGNHHAPEESPLDNAKKLLIMGMITQEEFDELQVTIIAAHAEFNRGDMLQDNDVEDNDVEDNDVEDKEDEENEEEDKDEDEDENARPKSINDAAVDYEDDDDDSFDKRKNSATLPVRHRALSQAAKYDLESLRGYMQKKAKTMSQWRRRWFSVKRMYDPKAAQWCMSICWHKDHNSAAITAVPIEMLTDVQRTEQKLMFKIMVSSPDGAKKRVILLKAETEEQEEAWVNALNNMIAEVKERMKTEFMRETRLSSMDSNLSLDTLHQEGGEGDLQTEHKVGATPSPRKRKKGKSKRTSMFEVPPTTRGTHASPAVEVRPDVHAMEGLQGVTKGETQNNNSELGSISNQNRSVVDDDEDEVVSVPASQGCACVIS